jgi:hypothetical protein
VRSTDIILTEQSIYIEMSLRVASRDRKNNSLGNKLKVSIYYCKTSLLNSLYNHCKLLARKESVMHTEYLSVNPEKETTV